MPVMDQAFVTLATNDAYCQGALVLGQSLRNHRTSRRLVVMVTSYVSHKIREVLRKVFDEVLEVNVFDSNDSAHFALTKRPELGITFTKIHCWTLTQYSKCVFMDADTMVLCNIDELFDREELSAAPDPGWPDCFSSGVFIFRPSLETYDKLLQFAMEHGSFDGGDQGLLNGFFSNWATSDIGKHLPFIYNLSSSPLYTYLPAFRHFGGEAKVVHFLGTVKPWQCRYNPQTRTVADDGRSGGQNMGLMSSWWETYHSNIVPLLVQHEESHHRESHHHTHHIGRIEVTFREEYHEPTHVPHHHEEPPSVYAAPPPPPAPQEADSIKSPEPERLPERPSWVLSHAPPPSPTSELGCRTPTPVHSPERLHSEVSTDVTTASMPSAPDRDTSMKIYSPESLTSVAEVISLPEVASLRLEPATVLVQRSETREKPAVLDIEVSVPEKWLSQKITSDILPGYIEEQETESPTILELSIQVKEDKKPKKEDSRKMWEEGRMDYMGKDAFAFIQMKLDSFLK